MDNSLNYTEVKTHKKSKYFYLLIVLILFHVIFNSIWIILNNQPPTWDAALHTILSFKIYELPNNFLKASSYYPPFVHIIGALLVFIFGYSVKAIQFTGTLFLVSALIFIYLYSKELFKSEKIAFFSALFFSFFLTIYEQSRYHMLDIPLTAMIFASLYFLEKSRNLKNTKFTILFFVFFGLATITKWYAVIFITVSLVFKLIGLIREKIEILASLKKISLGFLIFLILTLPWYITNLDPLLKLISYTSKPELADPQKLFSLENILFYPKLIIMFQTSFSGFIFLIISLFYFIKNKINKQKAIILISIAFTYLVFTLISNKNIRYLIPQMPFIAIIMGYGADWMLKKGKFISKIILSITISYLVLSYFILSFGFPVYPKYKYAINFPVLQWTDIYYIHTYPINALFRPMQKLPYDQILNDVKVMYNEGINVLIIAGSDYVNNYILDPYLYKSVFNRRKDFHMDDLIYLRAVSNDKNELANYLNKNVDIILTPKKYLGLPEGIREYEDLNRIHSFVLSGELKNFKIVKEYNLVGDEYHPDDTIILMKRI